MGQVRIFISYRRDDSAGFARAVGDALAQRFGPESVFIDVDDIGAGASFDRALDEALGAARVLLVLIGRRWLEMPAGGTRPRLHEPDDFVRREVLAGLGRGLTVIPLLVDGATMPGESELPAELRPLAKRQALTIDNARFADDLARLERALREALGERVSPATAGVAAAGSTAATAASKTGAAAPGTAPPMSLTTRRRAALFGLVGVGLATALAGAAWVAWRARPTAPPLAPAAPPAARPPIDGRWTAEVVYPWPNARYDERFEFGGDGTTLHGSASFLRVPRGIVEGRIAADGALEFTTRTQEQSGSALRELTHRYRGRLVGDELRLVMQTDGGVSPSGPLEFVARRVTP